jgi:hypothetical protein
MMNINGMPGKRVYRKVRENIPSDVTPAQYTLKFGMHQGIPLKDVPREYLEWVLLNVKNRPDAVVIIQKFMGVPPSPLPPISAAKGRVSRIASLTARNATPARAERDGGKGPSSPGFQHYRSLIVRHYNTSKEYDISTFNERGLFLYQRCMDSCRKMRAIIESMEESPASLGMLQTIYKVWERLSNKTPRRGV